MVLYILDVKKWKENNQQTGKKLHHVGGQFLLKYALGEEEYNGADFAVGKYGKPYIRNYDIHYNISHSGDYVVLVVGNSEVGVDIQEIKPVKVEALVKRFFSKGEQSEFAEKNISVQTENDATKCMKCQGTIKEQVCKEKTEHLRIFYHIWCRKEAYGKYLGCGLNEMVMRTNVLETVAGCYFQEYVDLDDYQISICSGKEEEIEKIVSVFEGL